jgi:hypothetical protein
VKNRITAKVSIFVLILSAFNFVNIKQSVAAVITATGTNPSVCDQVVGSSLGVSAQRIDNGDCVVQFKDTSTSNTWTVPGNVGIVSYLVVGGGGGGGNGYDNGGGGGGGGGMVLIDTITVTPGELISVSVGAGGAGGANTRTNNSGTSGTQSTFSTISAVGGGLGNGSRTAPGGAGVAGLAQSSNISSATGGNGGGGGGTGGGGGGANSNGSGSSGGSGKTSSITGTPIIFGAGGNGAPNSNTTGSAGTVNTGKGGGAGGATGSSSGGGGAGGSGVVVIRYIIPVSTFAASNYTAGSTTWANSITGATAGTAATGGMAKTSSGPTGVVFAGRESSNSDQISSSIGSTTSLDTVTVEMWLKLKDSGSVDYAAGSMLFSWNTSPNNYNIYHFGNQVGFNTFNSQLYGIDSTSYNNAWTHFVFVMTDAGPWSSQKVYVNGSLQASTCRVSAGNCSAAQTRSFASTGNFLLMDHPNTSDTWNAKTDVGLVRIYNQEISAASVQSLYNLTSADYATVPDTTPPTFTSSSSFSAAENAATSATAATIRVSESATVTISSGTDAARFNISRSDTDTAIIKFNVSPDYEAPIDSGGDNIYNLTLMATDNAGNAGTQSITITVTNVVDTSSFNSLALAGSATTAIFRTSVLITANVSVASKVTFTINGKVLPGCKNRTASGSGSSFSATCNWKPSRRGDVTLTAAATPTGAGITSTTAAPVSIRVGNRTGAR